MAHESSEFTNSLWTLLLLLLVVGGTCRGPNPSRGIYRIGVGRSDITGPSTDVIMMGYSSPTQLSKGIHVRLYARAFIVHDGASRLVYVSAEKFMMSQIVKIGVIKQLQSIFGDVYTKANVILSGTSTHSAPGGYLQYYLYGVSTVGFIQDNYDSIVKGIVQSIIKAHRSMVLGRLFLSSGDLLGASINGSPGPYELNPDRERAKYKYNVDKTMTLLKFVAVNGTNLGMVNWFPVQGTSMNRTNTLISSDNKGYASQIFEKAMNPRSLAGEGKFVAAFAQSHCADVSPNIGGPRCQDTSAPCSLVRSTCGGQMDLCLASGPGKNQEESTKIIGTKQFEKAMELFQNSAANLITGPVQFISQEIDIENYDVTLPNGKIVKTCKAAVGYGSLTGTIDGILPSSFTDGTTATNPFLSNLVNLAYPATGTDKKCHYPKPILVTSGDFNDPQDWHPNIVETQIGKIGQLVITAVPGEVTTMAGRRLINKVTRTMAAAGERNVVPVIAALSNAYSNQITTYQEYQGQYYEGAQTLYGPHTLAAYLQQFSYLGTAMVQGKKVDPGPEPPNNIDQLLYFQPILIYDGTSPGYNFGDVIVQPNKLAFIGETVFAKFVSGHPRNVPSNSRSFLTVERQMRNGRWIVVAKDADWSTKFSWVRVSSIGGTSIVTVSWHISEGTAEGTYRLTHRGYILTLLRGSSSYSGFSDEFKVVVKGDYSISPTRSYGVSDTGRYGDTRRNGDTYTGRYGNIDTGRNEGFQTRPDNSPNVHNQDTSTPDVLTFIKRLLGFGIDLA